MLEVRHAAPFPPIWWSDWWQPYTWMGDLIWIGVGLILGCLASVAIIVWIEGHQARHQTHLRIASEASDIMFPLRKKDVQIHIEVTQKKEN